MHKAMIAMLLLLMLSACGQYGKLYLPPKETANEERN